MQLSNINMKAFLTAAAASIVVFLAFYFLNRSPDSVYTTIIGETDPQVDAQIPALQPTSDTTYNVIKLDHEQYRARTQQIIQTVSLSIANALDIFDQNTAILTQMHTTQGQTLQSYFDLISTNYHTAKNIVPPAEYSQLHSQLTSILSQLDGAVIQLLSSAQTANQEQAAAGYLALQEGYNGITALATNLN